MYQIADSHAHLTDVQDLSGSIVRAGQSGVFAVVSMGMGLRSNRRALEIAEEHRNSQAKILVALGLHPWGDGVGQALGLAEVDVNPTLEHIEKNLQRLAGIGEVGLDYWVGDVRKDPRKKEVQRSAFRKVVTMATKYGKPISIHSRGAWEDCFDIVVEDEPKVAVFHWFSGSEDLVKKIVDHGFYVSATPAVQYSKEHRAAILNSSLDHLLLETDSPVKYGEMISEPKDVMVSLREIAKLKKVSMEIVAEKTTGNFSRIFAAHLR